MSKNFLAKLDWRHAAKSFDSTKPITQAELNQVLRAVRMAPTSFGLQPFHVRVISDETTKLKIFDAGWKQRQFSTCSHMLVFSNVSNVSKRITDMIEQMAAGDEKKREQLKGYEGMMRGFFQKSSHEQLQAWAERQAYIALGFGLAACAELEIESCPMEGFSVDDVNRILALPTGERVSVILTMGHRDTSVATRPKFRFPESDLFTQS